MNIIANDSNTINSKKRKEDTENEKQQTRRIMNALRAYRYAADAHSVMSVFNTRSGDDIIKERSTEE